MRFWDVTTGAETRKLEEHAESVSSVAFSPDGRTLAAGYGQCLDLAIWPTAGLQGRPLRETFGPADGGVGRQLR